MLKPGALPYTITYSYSRLVVRCSYEFALVFRTSSRVVRTSSRTLFARCSYAVRTLFVRVRTSANSPANYAARPSAAWWLFPSFLVASCPVSCPPKAPVSFQHSGSGQHLLQSENFGDMRRAGRAGGGEIKENHNHNGVARTEEHFSRFKRRPASAILRTPFDRVRQRRCDMSDLESPKA